MSSIYKLSKLFIKLANESEDELSDQELLQEYLENYEDISYGELVYLAKQLNFQIHYTKQTSNPPWGLWFIYNNKKYVVTFDDQMPSSNDIANNPKTIEDFLVSLTDSDLEKYVELPNFTEEFWSYPAVLYHATPKSNLKSILEKGLIADTQTRGMSNNSVGAAVFCSMNPDAIDAYGDTLLKIDTQAMKSDGFTPDVSEEPDIVEEKQRSAIAHMLGEENYNFEIESGIDYETVIMYSNIPAKYISIYSQ